MFYVFGIASMFWKQDAIGSDGFVPWPVRYDEDADPTILRYETFDEDDAFRDLQSATEALSDQNNEDHNKKATLVLRAVAGGLLILGLILLAISACCRRHACIVLTKFTPMLGGAVGLTVESIQYARGINPGNNPNASSQVFCNAAALGGIISGMLIALALSRDDVNIDDVERRRRVRIMHISTDNIPPVVPSSMKPPDYDDVVRPANRSNNPPIRAVNAPVNRNESPPPYVDNVGPHGTEPSSRGSDNPGASRFDPASHVGGVVQGTNGEVQPVYAHDAGALVNGPPRRVGVLAARDKLQVCSGKAMADHPYASIYRYEEVEEEQAVVKDDAPLLKAAYGRYQ
ncbi:hypothetical protein BaRGS_00000884 [Batillaria attramentaria]|uniref:Uncharacterized protein n=1 Tax=Batillaria attramentaria TaxID=370345 RepID=A0ABD0M7I2_9CAEN